MASAAPAREWFDELRDEVHELGKCANCLKECYWKLDDSLLEQARDFVGLNFYVLMERLVAGLCRLTDRPDLGKQSNLVLERAINEIGASDDDPLRASLRELSIQIKPLRKYRNKRLSHLDLEAMLNPASVLDAFTIGLPVDATEKVFEIVSCIAVRIQSPFMKLDDVLLQEPAQDLLHLLKVARRQQELAGALHPKLSRDGLWEVMQEYVKGEPLT
jgi:hypothetical protein